MIFIRKSTLLAGYAFVLLASGLIYSILYTSFFHSSWKTYQLTELPQQSMAGYENSFDPGIILRDDNNNTISTMIMPPSMAVTRQWEDDNASRIFWVEDPDTLPPSAPLLTPFVLSLKQFDFTITAEHTCNNSSDPIPILFVVISAPKNRNRRRAIRETWGGQVRTMMNECNRLIFFTGLDASKEANDRLLDESALHNDIVQGSFLENYKNLTWKSLLFLRWVSEHCHRARYVFKADDDVLINTQRLQAAMDLRSFSPSAITGHLARKWRVIRDHRSKWYVSTNEYPRMFLPSFLTGPAYVIGGNILATLLFNCLKTPYFYLEDVYITGMCARKADIPIINHPDFTNSHVAIERCYYNSVITSHGVTSEQLVSLWRKMDFDTGRLVGCQKVGSNQAQTRRYRIRRRHW